MCGSFYQRYDVKNMVINPGNHVGGQGNSSPVPSAGYNAAIDVESSKAFSASGAPITYAPLNITGFILMSEKDQALSWMRHSPLTDAFSGLYALWSVVFSQMFGRADWIICDCVPMGMVL